MEAVRAACLHAEHDCCPCCTLSNQETTGQKQGRCRVFFRHGLKWQSFKCLLNRSRFQWSKPLLALEQSLCHKDRVWLSQQTQGQTIHVKVVSGVSFPPSPATRTEILKAMEDRRFEWAVVENACCEAAVQQCLNDMRSWRLMNPRFNGDMVSVSTGKRLNWSLRTFTIYWDIMPAEFGRFFQCHVMGTFREDIWAYRLEFYEEGEDDEDGFTELQKQALRDYAVALREIPPSLVVTCNLVVEEDFFEAAFTTMSGREFLHLKEGLPAHGVLRGQQLIAACKEAAAAEGCLKSINQQVRILLNGAATEVAELDVLWCRWNPFVPQQCP